MSHRNLSAINRALRRIDPAYIRDGPVTEAYWKSSPKLLWILKEANAPDTGGWSLCDFLANRERSPNWIRTYGKVAEVSFGVLNGRKLRAGEAQAVLRQIAVINLNKSPGGRASVAPRELERRAGKFRGAVLRQIEALSPDVVIGGNTLSLLPELKLDDPIKISKSLWAYPAQSRLYLDAYHPACRMENSKYYDEILGAIGRWRN